MVFESILADLLNRFLGDYVQNFDSSQLKLGIWGGDVVLKQLDIKESALNELDLPIRVVSGHLGRLILKIPWKNMYTAPVIATIEGLYIVVIPNLAIKYDEEKEKKAAEAAKQTELARIEEAKVREAQKKELEEEKKDTFTEKLVTQIIKNLQVKIKDIHIRYEDTVSDRQNPFSLGFTMHNLSFETTNEKWIPQVIQDNVSVIHKLITLDSLAFYWNSNTVLFSNQSPEERQCSLKRCIATSSMKPEDVSYMLGPINSSAQLKLNSKPELQNFKEPKVWLDLVVEEIAVGLSRRQYRDLMKMLESFDRLTVASMYRKYRPDVPHEGHAKEWWKFAINAILEEDVRRKKQNWSWEHMRAHRNCCRDYKELYVVKLSGKKLAGEKLDLFCNCERRLDLFSITVARKQAELEVQSKPQKKKRKFKHSRKLKREGKSQKSWGSWIGGWFAASPATDAQDVDSTGKKIVKQFEEAMTMEEKAKLYEAIGYQEQSAVAVYPQEFVENQMFFLLKNLTLLLHDDTLKPPQVMLSKLRSVSTTISQRPAAGAMSFEAKMEGFYVMGTPPKSNTAPILVTSQQIDQQIPDGLPLLSILFETNPLDQMCDNRIAIDAQSLQVFYDACSVNRLIEVFKPPEQVDLQQLQATAMIKLEEMKEMSAFGLQYAIERHKTTELRIDVKPSFVIIPEKGVYKDDINMIVLSLGKFRMYSQKREVGSPTVKDMFSAGSSEGTVLSTMIQNAYDKFQISVTNAEIILSSPKDDWRRAIKSTTATPLHLLHPITIAVDLDKSIISVDPRLPKIKISGVLPEVEVSITDKQLFNILTVVRSIPFPTSTEEVVVPQTGKRASTAVHINAAKTKVMNKAKKEAVETFKTSDSDESEGSVESLSVQSTDLELKFVIKKFDFAFLHVTNVSQPSALRFAFHNLGTHVMMRTFDFATDLYLGAILLEYTGEYCKNDQPIKMISSSLTNKENDLFTIKYLQANKKGPDFTTTYNSILQYIDVELNNINFILHQDVLLSLMSFAKSLLSIMDTADVSRQSSVITGFSAKEEKDKADKLVVTKRKKEADIIDMKIRASLDEMHVLICNKTYDLTNIVIKGLSAVVAMDKAKTDVAASWKDIVVYDPSPDALYTRIVTTEAGEVLDIRLVLYNDATEDENYLDLNAVDIRVVVAFGRVKIVYLHKFISSLMLFLNHFHAAKERVMTASAVAAEAAKHGMEEVYDKATRILLNIIIEAPVIIIPQKSTSRNTIVADLGVLRMSNGFEFGRKRNELGVPAVIDKMILNLQNLKLSRALVNPVKNEVTAECLVLKPLSFSLAVIRNLSSGWYIEQPEVDVFGRLDAVKISMSNQDYATFMSVLSGNMAESCEVSLDSDSSEEFRQAMEDNQLVRPVTSQEIVQVKVEKPAAPEDFLLQKVYTRFKIGFEMDSAVATFYFGKTELTQPVNLHDSAQSMGVVHIEQIEVQTEIFNDSSISANVVLKDIKLVDSRAARKSGVKTLMERTSDDDKENMMSIVFRQNASSDKNLDVTICSFTFITCLPYVMKLKEFFSSMEAEEHPYIRESMPMTSSAISTKLPSTPKVSAVKTVPSGLIIITVKLEQPDIILIDDLENFDSGAIFLNTEITSKITIKNTTTVISGKVANVTFYTATYNPEKRQETMVKILNPSEIDLQLNLSDDSQHIDVLFKDVILQISPSTVQLVASILKSLTTEKVLEEEKEEEIVDYTDIWKAKPLNLCNFSFLETLSGQEKAMEATEVLSSTADSISMQQMLVTIRKVIITIEAGVGNRTVPMLLLESSFQAQIWDWATDLNIESSLSLELSYYNEKIAVWEPLIEPVETLKGHRSWELFMELNRRSEVENGLLDELDEMPPTLKMEIRSDDVMELTFSKCCLDVLMNLSKAFTEAVKLATVRDNQLPFAPYRVYNYLGMPVTLVLNKMFKVLDAEETYEEVILESLSPPLHLTLESNVVDDKTRISMLKKQFVKDDTFFNVLMNTEDMNVERRLSITCTDKRFFQLPRRTYPGDKWGFVLDISSVYGCKVVSFHSNVQVFNNFTIPIDVYFMMSSANEVEFCGTVEPNKLLYLPLHAVFTISGEFFFKPTEQPYSLSLEPFVWKQLVADPSSNKTLQCNHKDIKGQSFFINVAGSVERIYYEETNKKTVGSSLYTLNLYPTVRFRNLLLYSVNYSIQGVDIDYELKEGQTDELWLAELGKTGLEIRLKSYLDKNWTCCRILMSNIDELSVWTFVTSTNDRTMELGMHTTKVNGSIVMALYAPYCMINKTGLLLVYRDNEGNMIYHPPEVDKPVLFSFKAKAFFSKKKASLKVQDSEWSDKFSIDAVGNSGNVIAKTKEGKTYGIGVQIKLSQSGLSKMIIFTPFYILVNNCKHDIEYLELASDAEWVTVPKDQCVPLWPIDASKQPMMRVRYSGDKIKSKPFSYKDNQDILLKMDSKNGGIHVDCQVAQSSIIITFEDYVPGHEAALLVNHMSEYSVTFNQMGCTEEIVLKPYCCILYCWEDPTAKRILQWKCGDKKDGQNDLVKDEVEDFHPEPAALAYWLSFLDAMQRVMVFTHDLNRAFAVRAACQAVQMDQEFLVMLQGVGLSLVNNDSRLEIMYMGITSTGVIWEGKREKSNRFKALPLKDCILLETAYQRYLAESKISSTKVDDVQQLEGRMEVDFAHMKMLKPTARSLKRTFQTGLWLNYKGSSSASFFHAKINRLQIDNQLVDCVFPVVLSPVPLPKSVAAENAPKPFTELSIMLRKEAQSTVQQIKYCRILIQEFDIKLDQGFINSMISFFTPDKPSEIDYKKVIDADSELANSALKNVAAIYSSQEQKCYFDNLHFSPLKVHISFSMTGGGGSEDNKPTPIHSDLINILLQSVGVTLTEVQDVIFRLDYFERKHVFMSTRQLMNEATGHYAGQAVRQLYMLVLGLDVIGNPVGLFLGLGEGVTDFFYEPFQGAIQGPEEFFEGLGLGVKSLFGHAIGGTAGAASRITGTLGKGLAALTLDKDYQKRRRQSLNRRPQDVTQRLAQSGKGLVMGVFDGVTGVVTQPWEGAKEEGGWGFAKGMARGLIGIVARPTAGAVDFVSGTFDSVKRLAELHDEIKRLRPPRYIRADGVIRPYVQLESEGNRILQELEKGKYVSTDVYEGHIFVGVDQKSCLVVTNNRIMYVSKGDVFGQWNTEWEYRFEELKGFPVLTDSGIKIMLRDPHKKKMSLFGSKVAGKLVHASDVQRCQWIITKIQEIMKNQSTTSS